MYGERKAIRLCGQVLFDRAPVAISCSQIITGKVRNDSWVNDVSDSNTRHLEQADSFQFVT